MEEHVGQGVPQTLSLRVGSAIEQLLNTSK